MQNAPFGELHCTTRPNTWLTRVRQTERRLSRYTCVQNPFVIPLTPGWSKEEDALLDYDNPQYFKGNILPYDHQPTGLLNIFFKTLLNRDWPRKPSKKGL